MKTAPVIFVKPYSCAVQQKFSRIFVLKKWLPGPVACSMPASGRPSTAGPAGSDPARTVARAQQPCCSRVHSPGMLACALRKQSSVRTALEASKRGAGNAAAGSAEGHRNGAATNTNAPSSYRGTPGGPTAAAGTKGGDSRHPPKRAVRPLWDRNQLNSQWDEVKESYCGRLGRVTRLDHIGSQVEIEFQNDPQPVQRLVYPLDAVGLPVAHDLPLNDAREMLRMGGNAIGLKVRVRDDVAFVRQCFTGHSGNIPFVEELGTDMHAVRNCGVVFLAAFLTAMAAERCGSWFHLVTVILWVAIAYDVIYLERVRCRRIELLSERQVQQQRQRSAVPDEEAVDWVNGVLWKLWTPMQKTVAKKLHASLQSTVRT